MKVFFTLDSIANAGTEKSTLALLSNFSPSVDAKVIHFFPGFDLEPAYKAAGIKMHYADLKGKRAFFQGTRLLVKMIKAEKPDLIVSSIMRANFMSRLAGLYTGTPVIGTLVSDSYGATRIAEMKKKGLYRKFRVFWLLDKATSWIPKYWISNARSIAISNKHALGIASKKIKVIYRGREFSGFPPRRPIDGNLFRFVFIGRIQAWKGVKELINAFRKVKENEPNVFLDIYGEGQMRESVEATIGEVGLSDSVRLHGVVPNGWQKLYEAHCFVFPSWYEGFSGSLIEAMMAEVPIIASDIPMNLEAVSSNTATIFKVRDADDLADKMLHVLRNYPSTLEMARVARSEASRRFDIKNISKEYETFLQEVVTKSVNEAELL